MLSGEMAKWEDAVGFGMAQQNNYYFTWQRRETSAPAGNEEEELLADPDLHLNIEESNKEFMAEKKSSCLVVRGKEKVKISPHTVLGKSQKEDVSNLFMLEDLHFKGTAHRAGGGVFLTQSNQDNPPGYAQRPISQEHGGGGSAPKGSRNIKEP
ncbi:hypothetical protein U0070_003328 [Myodes glareolus]|uniref:tRNA selenocysteine 1-associated protein 1 C-terminal domain-containing protein n=1 Tax=Myodes glareolus TaxID=447135 RepID=A0AAW0JBQ7_MYOGA